MEWLVSQGWAVESSWGCYILLKASEDTFSPIIIPGICLCCSLLISFWENDLRRLLRVLWTAGRSNQSILKEINPEYLVEGLMLKLSTLATWFEDPTHWKRPWCWERLKAGGEGISEDEMVGWYHWLNGQEFKQSSEDSRGQGSLVCCSPWGLKESDKTERLKNNTTGLILLVIL